MPQIDCSYRLQDSGDPCGVLELREAHISDAAAWLDAHGQHEEADRLWDGGNQGVHLGRLIKRGGQAVARATADFARDHWRDAATTAATMAASYAGFNAGLLACAPLGPFAAGCATGLSMAAAGLTSGLMAKYVKGESTQRAVASAVLAVSTTYLVRQVFAITKYSTGEGKTLLKLVVSIIRKK